MRDFKIWRVNKIRDPKILRVYKITVRDFNFYVDVTEAKWEIRDFKLLRFYKTTVRVRNFYVDVKQASCEIRTSKILRVYKIRDWDFTWL